MATMTAHQQYSRSSNRSRRQQEKFGEDVALANYMTSNKMRHHKQKQVIYPSLYPSNVDGCGLIHQAGNVTHKPSLVPFSAASLPALGRFYLHDFAA